jgi:hypothetical protein
MREGQKSEKQDADFMMKKRHIAEAGYGKRNPGSRNAKLEHSVCTLEAIRVN